MVLQYSPDSPIQVITAPRDVQEGDFVEIGSTLCRMMGSAKAGEQVPIVSRGCFNVPKSTNLLCTMGQFLQWDEATRALVDSTTRVDAVVVSGAEYGATTVLVDLSIDSALLDGSPSPSPSPQMVINLYVADIEIGYPFAKGAIYILWDKVAWDTDPTATIQGIFAAQASTYQNENSIRLIWVMSNFSLPQGD